MGGGLAITARVGFAPYVLGTDAAFGILGSVLLIGYALSTFPAGIFVDRANPHVVLIASTFAFGVLNLILAMLLATNTITVPVLLAIIFLEGVATGVQSPALYAAQATLVPVEARGAATIMVTLRIGIGFALGAAIADFVTSAVAIDVLVGALFLLSGFLLTGQRLLLRRKTPVGSGSPSDAPRVRAPRSPISQDMRDLWRGLRLNPQLSRAVLADLLMRIVIPTSLLASMITDHEAVDYAGQLLAAGAIGGLAAGLALATRGAGGNVRRLLIGIFASYAALLVLAVVLIDSKLQPIPGLSPVLLALGAALAVGLPIFGSGMLRALVQQRSPDDIRGKLTGLTAAPRLLAQAAVGIFFTVLIAATDAHVGLLATAIGVVLVMILMRGFARIDVSAD